MGKKYELGEKASLFVDTTTGKKIAPGQQVEFSSSDMRSKKFKSAVLNGHIKIAGKEVGEDDDDEGENLTDDQKTFRGLKTNKLKAQYLVDTYELDEEDIKKIWEMNKTQLHDKFDELEAEDAEDEE